MKVTYNWLKDFVDIKIPAPKLADKLTMAGLEVTSLEEREGDFIFEIEVTSNRPDLLSVLGIAREVAAITGRKIKFSSRLASGHRTPDTEHRNLEIKIENKKDCPLYTAKIINDIKIGPSPDWLKKRLELVGCRSVNNAVDITNYVLFELGEPLHAFDLGKLLNNPTRIIVRRATNTEKIVTIDGIERTLDENILVIASPINEQTNKRANEQTDKPIALAGIMGGKETEVSESTTKILLEAALFNPVITRRSRQRLGVQSESAYRFERGIDLEMVEFASRRAVGLIQEICAGKCVLARESGAAKTKKRSIILGLGDIQKNLGVRVNLSRISGILNNLGFKLSPRAKNSFTVRPSSYRQDVNLEIDLIEEIARVFGYEHIPKTLPKVRPQIDACPARGLVDLTKNILVGLGLNEAITYSLVDRDLLLDCGLNRENQAAVEILNPLSKEQEILRPLVFPSLIRAIAHNLNQKQEYVNIFEVARVFSKTSAQPKESSSLGIALCGVKPILSESGLLKEKMGLLHLKGILEILFERLGIKNYTFKKLDNGYETGVHVNQEKIGMIAALEKNVLDNFDIKNKDVVVAEVLLDRLFTYADLDKRFIPPPRYPGIIRDISFILKEEIAADVILEALQEKGRPLLRQVKITDYYKGKQIPSGFRGLTVSCAYRSDERTLTELEINPVHALVLAVLTDRFGAKLR